MQMWCPRPSALPEKQQRGARWGKTLTISPGFNWHKKCILQQYSNILQYSIKTSTKHWRNAFLVLVFYKVNLIWKRHSTNSISVLLPWGALLNQWKQLYEVFYGTGESFLKSKEITLVMLPVLITAFLQLDLYKGLKVRISQLLLR